MWMFICLIQVSRAQAAEEEAYEEAGNDGAPEGEDLNEQWRQYYLAQVCCACIYSFDMPYHGRMLIRSCGVFMSRIHHMSASVYV